ncbi:hypothetical protein AB7107_17295, partial [Proteus terrae]
DSIKKMQGDISKKADDNKTVHVGDFGVGATADNGPIIPLTPPDANDITSAGFYGAGGANSANYFEPYKPLIVSTRQGGDGTGAVLQIQSGGTVQAPLLANRIRVNAKAWSDWSVLASLTNSETQRFNGQLMSYQGLYSSDKSNPTNYFGLLRAEKGVPYGFYLSYDGSGYSIRFPEKIGGTILIDKTPPTVSKKDINKNGFYQCQDIEPYNVMFMGIACTHISNDAYVFSLWGRGNRFLFSTKDNGAWLGTWEVWTTANARADTNGFIKKASP